MEKFDFHKMDNIRVIARFRPASEGEKREEKIQKLDANEPKFRSIQEVVMKRPKKEQQNFKGVLDHIFKMSTTQKKIFDLVGRPMVQAVLEGYNSTIFAYGQTGSGKTYTMFGPEKRKKEIDLGLVQRCCVYLFDKLKKLTQGVSADVTEYAVSAAFIQIYKEHLSDLLEPAKRNMQIRTNFQTDTPYVENLKWISVNNIEDLLIHLGIAFSNRIVASHKLNSTSSRSHMLLMMSVEQKTKEGAVKRSKLNFGDLAGSEDIRKALGSNPDPERMKEAIAINSSLTALTTAINNLAKGQRPSYRSSSLTHILQDSLGGNSKTTMMVAASPHCSNRTETIRTLRFAMTAKTVKNKAKVNKEYTRSQLMRRIEELEAMNAKLKARVIELETQMQAAGLEVELSTDLYGDGADRNEYDDSDFSGDEFDESGSKKKKKKKKKLKKGGDDEKTDGSTANGNKGGKKKKGGKKRANLQISDNSGVSSASTQQLDALKREIDRLNNQSKASGERNADLEQRTISLTQEIDMITQQLNSSRETIEEMNKTAANFGKERIQLESRVEDLTKELTQQQSSSGKQIKDLDKQIQRQRNNISMKADQVKELQKTVKELNLQNEDLLKQNDRLDKQMTALRRQAYKNNPELANDLPMDDDTKNMIKQLDGMELDNDEKNMEPADLLLHRFAATEANDFRLTPNQRMKKTAKMMTDLSDDINGLMDQWLPKNKVRADRKRSKALVFQVRQLVGHFNVLVKQMKSTEASFQNDLKLDIRRRDQEINKLKDENKLVHQLQDDMAEKDEVIQQLKKHRDDLRVERDHLKAQTIEQQDMIFDVQNQVRYLNTELERNRSTIVELKKTTSTRNADDDNGLGLNLQEILDGDEPEYSSTDEEDSDDDDRPTPSNKKRNSKTNGKKAPTKQLPKISSKKKNKHQSQVSDEIIEMSDEEDDEQQNSVVVHEEVDDEDDERHYDNDDNDDKYTALKKQSPRTSPNKNKNRKKKRRKSTMSMWREGLKPGDQLDCKDESGLWWTAKIVGYKGNSDKLQIRYDGWGDQYDEVIDRQSDRLAVYKSMFHSKKGGKKLIKEGYMSKEGKMFKTWRKRYFTLDDQGAMSYYHNKGDDNPIGTLDVKLMKKTERSSFGRNKQFGLTLYTENRIWKFLCANEKDLAEWIHSINFVKRGQFSEDD